jgi:large subunit ribosomal protein L29
MKFKEIKDKNIKELNSLLSQNREKLRELRFKDANKQLKNVREIRQVRLLISKILTALNQK